MRELLSLALLVLLAGSARAEDPPDETVRLELESYRLKDELASLCSDLSRAREEEQRGAEARRESLCHVLGEVAALESQVFALRERRVRCSTGPHREAMRSERKYLTELDPSWRERVSTPGEPLLAGETLEAALDRRRAVLRCMELEPGEAAALLSELSGLEVAAALSGLAEVRITVHTPSLPLRALLDLVCLNARQDGRPVDLRWRVNGARVLIVREEGGR